MICRAQNPLGIRTNVEFRKLYSVLQRYLERSIEHRETKVAEPLKVTSFEVGVAF